MKLDPGFVNHWKTERLVDQLGAEGVVAVLRLWGNAQIRRQFTGLQLTPKRLAMELKWRGDETMLFDVFTDTDAPWLDKEPDGSFTIHGFEEHQHQVVKLWANGKKGGRPPKSKPSSSTSSSSSSSSSSSPICEPNGNHMVLNGGENPKRKRLTPTQKKITKIDANTPLMIRIGGWFGRNPKTLWTVHEADTLAQIKPSEAEVNGMEVFYLAEDDGELFRRHDLITLLNNWQGELDKARGYARKRRGAA